MTIDWWTLGLQAINFLVLVWLLHRVLYRPVLAVIEKRRRLTDKTLDDARQIEATAEASRRHYEEAEAGLEEERKAMLELAHGEIEAERSRILDEARRQAAKLIADARDKTAAERDTALATMRGEIAGLGTDIARTLLARVGGEISPESFFARLEATLDAMPDVERDRLAGSLTDNCTPLVVATAAPVGDATMADWRKRLGSRLGSGTTVSFVSDPALVAGVELRFPHTTIGDSFAAQLDRTREALAGHDRDS